MEWKELLEELVTVVESASPKLWEIVTKQVYTSTIGYFLFFLVLIVLASILFIIGKKARVASGSNFTDDGYDSQYSCYLLFTAISIGLYCLALLPLYSIVARVINPHYYAIELLLNHVK